MSNLESTLRPAILSYLAQGLSHSQVARAVNCSPAYISQLLTEEDFKVELAEAQSRILAETSSYDAQLNRVEQALLNQIEKTIPMIVRPEAAVALWAKINAGKRRASSNANIAAASAAAQNTTIVNLQLPPAILKQYAVDDRFTLNAKNQVIEAGGQTLVTMHAAELDKLAAKNKTNSTGDSNVQSLPAPHQKSKGITSEELGF